ncbi:MAG: PA14 domain-containing protein [bacterium]|nr:PA14 domain-containing protein [bacterium]
MKKPVFMLVMNVMNVIAAMLIFPQVALAAPNYHASDTAKQASAKNKKQDNVVVLDEAWRGGDFLYARFSSPTTDNQVLLDLEIYNSAGQQIAQQSFDNVFIPRTGTASYQDVYNIVLPANLSDGQYRLAVGIFTPGWQQLITWNDNALSFNVQASGAPSDPRDESGCFRPGTNNFIACYYNTIDFTEFRKYRTDSQINFDWGLGSPDPSVDPDTFSARWSGLFEFEPGVYDFTVTTSDGMRLYADNQLLLDKWFDQPTTTYTVRATISGGQRGVIAEYYENTGEAVAKVSWVKVN